VFVCTQPANVVFPPTPLAAIYSDPNGLVPITQPLITDGFGHAYFYALPGLYTVIIANGGIIQQTYPDQSLGGVGTGTSGGTALVLEVQGVPTASQLLQNLVAGPNITITADGVGNTTITGATQQTSYATAGQGYFLGAQSFAPISDDTGHSASPDGVANEVYGCQLILTASYTIRKIAAMVVTGNGSAQAFTAGIYNAAGTQLLVDAGPAAFDTTGSQRYREVTLATPVTIGPGVYLFACGANGTTGGSVLCHVLETWFTSMLNGISLGSQVGSYTRVFIAANTLTGSGDMPATLGALTPRTNSNPVSIPAVLFEV
jgi:hypothetical protein